ncbi:MAG TPA: hypothetical protein VJ783_22720 [Pirellulales bacterium]|nr:hypothetical protein [Pirellulales bacterium]
MLHTNHLAYLVAKPDDVLACLRGEAKMNTARLPLDAEIVDLRFDPGRELFAIWFESPSFAEVPEGDCLPCLGDAQFEQRRP